MVGEPTGGLERCPVKMISSPSSTTGPAWNSRWSTKPKPSETGAVLGSDSLGSTEPDERDRSPAPEGEPVEPWTLALMPPPGATRLFWMLLDDLVAALPPLHTGEPPGGGNTATTLLSAKENCPTGCPRLETTAVNTSAHIAEKSGTTTT